MFSFFIHKTAILFNTNSIKLNEFEAKTGTSDLSLNGNLDNFYGFLFKDQVLKGNFNLNSNNLKVADFLSKETTTSNDKTPSSALKIPAFLDIKLNATAKTVLYDNINLSNVSGDVYIKDEAVKLQNLKTDVFGGNIGFSGNVSTKEKTPKFAMDLDLKQLNIADSFSNLEMLKSIAPIAKSISGKINSTIKVSGFLNDDMTPKELLKHSPYTGAIGEMMTFLFTFIYSAPYEPFIPITGKNDGLFFDGGVTDPRNIALVELRTKMIEIMDQYTDEIKPENYESGPAQIHQWPLNVET